MLPHLAVSDANRWVPCPASAGREAAIPRREKPAADEGSALHDALADLGVGVVLEPGAVYQGVSLTVDQINLVNSAYQDVVSWCGYAPSVEWGFTAFEGLAHGRADTVASVHAATPEDLKTGFIGEYKMGRGAVPAIGNYQLLLAAFGLHEVDPCETYRMKVFSPRAFNVDPDKVEWTVTGPELESYRPYVLSKAKDALSGSPVVYSGDHCKHCTARAGCAAVAAAASNAVDRSENGVLLTEDLASMAEEYRTLKRAKRALETRFEVLDLQLTDALKHGRPVPGFKLGRHAAHRRFVQGFDGEAFERRVKVSPFKREFVTPAELERRGAHPDLVAAHVAPGLSKMKLMES